MFEATLPVAAENVGAEGAPRAFDWGELVARINAAHDVHLLLRPRHANRVRHASFAAQANREGAVNLAASADGKDAPAECMQTTNDMNFDHRGTR
ncbi:hypothetical protein [Tsuneonella mangrovi]|uniref:hypothetical protein n=1 Tax=Tsuneonella mangrovi TaxID=1982042 RepID=UPI000BA2A1CB|nr:hypothetical protein [Tsuneonella mangrovi]